MMPTQEHISFMSAMLSAQVAGTINDLMHACPNASLLPDVEESVRFVRACRERGVTVKVTDVVAMSHCSRAN